MAGFVLLAGFDERECGRYGHDLAERGMLVRLYGTPVTERVLRYLRPSAVVINLDAPDAWAMAHNCRIRFGPGITVLGLTSNRDALARDPRRLAAVDGVAAKGAPLITLRAELRRLCRIAAVSSRVGAADCPSSLWVVTDEEGVIQSVADGLATLLDARPLVGRNILAYLTSHRPETATLLRRCAREGASIRSTIVIRPFQRRAFTTEVRLMPLEHDFGIEWRFSESLRPSGPPAQRSIHTTD